MNSDAPPATKDEKRRMETIAELGCLCCWIRADWNPDNYVPGRAEVHHMIQGHKRLGHDHTIGLCAWHHRGEPGAFSKTQATEHFGPALSEGTRPFHAHWGSDKHLLQLQDLMIEAATRRRSISAAGPSAASARATS